MSASVVGKTTGDKSTVVDRKVCFLKVVNEQVVKSGHGAESLAAHMSVNKSYTWRVLNGESALGLPFLLSLPDDVLAGIAVWAAEYFGYVVIKPASDERSALRQLASVFLSPAFWAFKAALQSDAQADERKAG